MIRFNQVGKRFASGTQALKDITVHIKEGTIYGVIGLSGAGKSTFIRCINGLEKPTEGQVLVDGKDVGKLSGKELRALRQDMGMIFQSFNLFRSKTIFENVAFPLRIQKKSEAEIKERVEEMLELVGIKEKAKDYPSQLSGGQKQRVAIARALVSHPRILLLDEATSALDPTTSGVILQLIKELKEKLDLTVVLITHDMSVVKQICSEMAILEGGNLIQEGPVNKVFRSPHLRRVHHHSEVPEGIISGKTLSLSFSSTSAKEPIISQLIKDEDIYVNILVGSIEYVSGEPLGSLLIEVDPQEEARVRTYLLDHGVEVEEYSCNDISI